VQLDWTVVASKDIVVYDGVGHPVLGLLVYDKIVQSPADVLCPASGSHAPPGVLHFFRMLFSESVDPSLFQKFGETLPFLDSESSCLFISLWPGNIYLLMTDVQISTKNDGLFLL
jgi:hypothetical protein